MKRFRGIKIQPYHQTSTNETEEDKKKQSPLERPKKKHNIETKDKIIFYS
jgi:hypothetical protein